MTDDISTQGPFSRTLVYVALAALIAMVVMVAAPILGSSSTQTVGFTATIKVAEGEVNAFGSARLADGRIGAVDTRMSSTYCALRNGAGAWCKGARKCRFARAIDSPGRIEVVRIGNESSGRGQARHRRKR
jgi:hypothetical protein